MTLTFDFDFLILKCYHKIEIYNDTKSSMTKLMKNYQFFHIVMVQITIPSINSPEVSGLFTLCVC